MHILKTWRDPYDSCFSICSRKQIELKEGLTVLVGCNGSGKSTTLHNLKSELESQNIPCYEYDNLRSGNSSSISSAIFHNDMNLAAGLWTSSEGERIFINIGQVVKTLHEFIVTGESPESKKSNRWAALIHGDFIEGYTTDKRFILLDAIDSGFSVDNVVEIRDLFDAVIEDAQNLQKELYIIISANEYELARNAQCLDVTTGKYLTFADYEDYRKFILASRKKKDKRIQTSVEKCKIRDEKRKAVRERKQNQVNNARNRHYYTLERED